MVFTSLAGCSSAAKSKNEKTTLSFMVVGTEADPYIDGFKTIVDRFNQENEYNVTIEMTAYENEQHKTKLTTLMAADAAPDIFYTYELAFLKPFVDANKVADITSYFDADPEWKNSFMGGTLDVLSYDGKNYGVPTESVIGVMFYNKEIFEKYGLTIPNTYDEFLTICETLKSNDIIPMTLACSDAWIPAQFVQQLSAGIGGGQFFFDVCDGKANWNDPINVKAAEEMLKMAQAGYFQEGYLGTSPEESVALYTSGKAAMYFQGTWDTGLLLDSEVGPVTGAFVMPAFDSQYSNFSLGSVDGSFAISSKCQNKDAAVALLKFWSSPEIQEYLLYNYSKAPSTNISVDESKLSSLMLDVVNCSSVQRGLMPWWDRQFGAGEGVEFNNTCVAILGGEDALTAFTSLQQFAEDNQNR